MNAEQAAALRGRRFDPVRISYRAKDTILYALSIGAGRDPLDPETLRYVYESGLVALPAMACVLGHRSIADYDLGIDYARVVHGFQSLTLHDTLPPEGELIVEASVGKLLDHGADRGATLVLERALRDADSGRLIAQTEIGILCRGDGGFSDEVIRLEKKPVLPAREVDHVVEHRTSTDAALLYRLNGDYNPLHVDPAVARRAGFERPILHGLATFGIAQLAVIRAICVGDERELAGMGGRFTAPVLPGDTLIIELWRNGEGANFRVGIPDRGVTAIDNGWVRLNR